MLQMQRAGVILTENLFYKYFFNKNFHTELDTYEVVLDTISTLLYERH